VRQRDYLLEIIQAISQELDLEVVLTRILSISVELLAGQAGLISLRSAGEGWSISVSQGIPKAFYKQLEHLLAQISISEDPGAEELPQVNKQLQSLTRSASLGLLTGVGLPLIYKKQVIGVLYVFRSYRGVFSNNDRALLQSFADQAAIAVQNARLYSRARYEEQRMLALLDSAADGVLIIRPDHRIEHCNPSFARMLGIAVDKIKNSLHPEVVRFSRLKNGQTLEQAEMEGWPLMPTATLYVEGDLERPGKQPLPVGITYAPLFSNEGDLVNIIGTVRDISHFREAEELKSTFISVISHELKTPVALIKGYVGTLRRDDAVWDPEVVNDSLGVIEEESDRLNNLINDLLDATRLQSGALSLNHCMVSLSDMVSQIVERFQTQSPEHVFDLDFPEFFPEIVGDEDRITQVLTNLLSNAIKYSPQGSTITLKGFEKDEFVVICISDQGPGIAVDDIPHVFDRFYRSEEASRTTQGAGLGLFLARAVVEAHRGRIWVDPESGAGAKICFSLPKDIETGIEI
jgi:signal transduction histidine kinase